jgi:hypothetical protein
MHSIIYIFLLHHVYMNLFCFLYLHCNIQWCIFSCQIWVKNSSVICLHLVKVRITYLKAYRLSELIFLFILKVANIRCFILIKCSEPKARLKKMKIVRSSVILLLPLISKHLYGFYYSLYMKWQNRNKENDNKLKKQTI